MTRSATRSASALPSAEAGGAWRRRLTAPGGMWLPILVVMVLIGFFGVMSPPFLSWRNFSAITGEAATLLIASLGASFVILMGSIDLSVGAIVLLVGAICVTLLISGVSGLLMLPIGAALGAAFGAANGAVCVLGRVPSFVVTLGTLSVFTGAALSILGGRAIMFDAAVLQQLAIGQAIPRLPNISLFALLLWLACVAIGLFTRFGRFALLVGGGEIVARTAEEADQHHYHQDR